MKGRERKNRHLGDYFNGFDLHAGDCSTSPLRVILQKKTG